jgi:SOS response regulatory protein OraA/RecX
LVLLEVDGEAWRTVPDGVVAACGLAVDVELDRPLLRALRNELRHAEAMVAAGRVLRRRDTSRRALNERLERAGVAAVPRDHAVTMLAKAGVVDDVRFAERRAAALAERGWGDGAIRARLEAEGVEEEAVMAAVGQLTPERERGQRLTAGIRDPRKAWNLLCRRGFDPDTIADLIPPLDGGDESGLG